MNESIKNTIYEEIKNNDKIIITRHFRPDGDAVGSTNGLKKALSDTFPEKQILLINDDYSDRLSFFGDEDMQAEDVFYRDALIIVVDTGTEDRISNKKYALGKKIIKIDHHICEKPYGDIIWIEENRASASEMAAEFCLTNPEIKMSKEAALYFYTGIVTDTGRFQFITDGKSLDIASRLLSFGIDTETLYANLYLEDITELKFRGDMYSRMKITENGVAYIHITEEIKERYSLTNEQASGIVSLMDKIKGSLIWLAFIDNGDGSTRVRLRSRFVAVQPIATHFHGGGHEKASGATVYSKQEMDDLISEADSVLKEYKETHEGRI